MHAMHYQFAFPDGFDLQSVRDRVAAIGHRFDGLPGLHFKAFLVSERRGGDPALYAPFYVWKSPQGMRDFLLSDAFAAVCARYGRPEVRQWMPLHFIDHPKEAATPAFATREIISLPAEKTLAAVADDEAAWARVTAAHAGVHAVFVGVDVHSWSRVRLVLWNTAPDGRPGFELLHLARAPSSPHAA